MARERATELEWLKWFICNCDLGPGEGEVRDAMAERFMADTGKNLPEGWNYYSDGETSTDKD